MVTAGDKYTDNFPWGKAEQFHTVEQDGKQFRLFDIVTITTNEGYRITGEIGDISEGSVDILPERQSAKKVKFDNIKNISY